MGITKKVWQNKSNGQKCITIPKDSGIEVGDHVEIIRVEKPITKLVKQGK